MYLCRLSRSTKRNRSGSGRKCRATSSITPRHPNRGASSISTHGTSNRSRSGAARKASRPDQLAQRLGGPDDAGLGRGFEGDRRRRRSPAGTPQPAARSFTPQPKPTVRRSRQLQAGARGEQAADVRRPGRLTGDARASGSRTKLRVAAATERGRGSRFSLASTRAQAKRSLDQMRVRIVDLEIAAQDVELVALRVGQRDPAQSRRGGADPRPEWHRGRAIARPPPRACRSVGRRSRWSRFLICLMSGTSMKRSRVRPSAEKIMHSSWPGSLGSFGSSAMASASAHQPTWRMRRGSRR